MILCVSVCVHVCVRACVYICGMRLCKHLHIYTGKFKCPRACQGVVYSIDIQPSHITCESVFNL